MPFDIGVPVCGDIAVALWFGAYNLGQRLHSRPAAAYAFHTAFFESGGVDRITVHQLDVADPALFPRRPSAASSWTSSSGPTVPATQRLWRLMQMERSAAALLVCTSTPCQEFCHALWAVLMKKVHAWLQTLAMPLSAQVLAGDVKWMRDKWRELMAKMYGVDSMPMPSPDKRMDDVLAEMKGRIRDGPLLRKEAHGPRRHLHRPQTHHSMESRTHPKQQRQSRRLSSPQRQLAHPRQPRHQRQSQGTAMAAPA